MSLAWIVTGSTSPAYVLSVGCKYCSCFTVYNFKCVCTDNISCWVLAGTDSAGCPFSSNSLYEVVSIGTSFSTPLTVALPGLKVTSFDCSTPCASVVSAGEAVGVTPTIDGV